MSEQDAEEPREVELIFEDETPSDAEVPGDAEASNDAEAPSDAEASNDAGAPEAHSYEDSNAEAQAGTERSIGSLPRFTQSSTGHDYESRPAGIRSYTPFGSEGGSSRSYSPPRGAVPSSSHGLFDEASSDSPEATQSIHALWTGPLPTALLAGCAMAIGVFGVVAKNVGGAFAFAGLSVPLTGAEGALVFIARGIGYLFSFLGAFLLVFAVWALLRRRGEKAAASALLVSMWTVGLVSSAMALLALGPVPYIVSAIAFPAALSTVSLVLVKQRPSGAFRKGGVLSVFVLVALTTVFIAAGRATLVGSIASLLLGAVAALLGVRLWNRWWAPILDAREYFRSRRHRSFDR